MSSPGSFSHRGQTASRRPHAVDGSPAARGPRSRVRASLLQTPGWPQMSIQRSKIQLQLALNSQHLGDGPKVLADELQRGFRRVAGSDQKFTHSLVERGEVVQCPRNPQEWDLQWIRHCLLNSAGKLDRLHLRESSVEIVLQGSRT